MLIIIYSYWRAFKCTPMLRCAFNFRAIYRRGLELVLGYPLKPLCMLIHGRGSIQTPIDRCQLRYAARDRSESQRKPIHVAVYEYRLNSTASYRRVPRATVMGCDGYTATLTSERDPISTTPYRRAFGCTLIHRCEHLFSARYRLGL